jgi:hypothetical protein
VHFAVPAHHPLLLELFGVDGVGHVLAASGADLPSKEKAKRPLRRRHGCGTCGHASVLVRCLKVRSVNRAGVFRVQSPIFLPEVAVGGSPPDRDEERADSLWINPFHLVVVAQRKSYVSAETEIGLAQKRGSMRVNRTQFWGMGMGMGVWMCEWKLPNIM